MEVRFNVNLVELKQACGRLVARWLTNPRANPISSSSQLLEAHWKSEPGARPKLCQQLSPSRDELVVPRRVFCGLVNVLRYCRGKTVEFDFSAGTITLSGRTQIRHPQISVSDGTAEALTSVELE